MRSVLFGLVLACGFAAACGRSNLEEMLFEEGSGASAAGTGKGGTDGGGGKGSAGGSAAGNANSGGGAGMPGVGASAGFGAVGGTSSGGFGGITVDAGPDAPLTCGDGVLDPGEACDLPAGNQSRPALAVIQNGVSVAVSPLITSNSVQEFYFYDSSSSHTGFEELGVSRVFMHRSSFDQALSLVMFHGIDQDSTGQDQPAGLVAFTISGLPNTAVVALSDDSGEVIKTNATTVSASWKFNHNCDGGVIGGLPFPGNWSITVTPSFIQGISSWDYLDGSSALFELDGAAPMQIVASDTPGTCRSDCTIPACGDGILDGGEVCDDGNSVGGDGCSAGCLPE